MKFVVIYFAYDLIFGKMVFHKGEYVKEKVFAKIGVKFVYSFFVPLPRDHIAQ